MDLIDEVIGYAKANAEAPGPSQEAWGAHQRNCVLIKAEVERLSALWITETRENEILRDALHVAREAIESHFDDSCEDCRKASAVIDAALTKGDQQ